MSVARVVQLDAPWAGQTFSPPLPLDLSSIERALIDHLRAMATQYGGPLTQVAIEHFPDSPENYRLMSPVGAILVTFGGADYTSSPMSVDEVVAERTITWDFAVIARDLGWAYGGQASGGSPGAYAILESLRLALCGFQIPGCTKMAPAGEKFTRRDPDGGVWYYEAKYRHRAVVVQVEPEVAYPLWVQITWLDRGLTTATDVAAELYTFDAAGLITLPHQNISELVVADVTTGDTYSSDTPDYILFAGTGIIQAASTGPLAPGVTVAVSYRTADITVVPAPN